MNFTHLHVHDEYSELDGYGSPEKFVSAAKEKGFAALGITNHGNVNSFINFQNVSAKSGLQPIFGCELYIDRDRNVKDKSSQRKHINVFVKNDTGYHNLLKLLTIANLEGFHYKPRIDPETLLRHTEGLIVSSACIGNPMSEDWGIILFDRLIKKMKGDVYFEIMPVNIKGQSRHNKYMIDFAKENNCKIIATNDVHYINKDDHVIQDIMLAINSKQVMSNKARFKFDSKTHYLATPGEMVKLFKQYQPGISLDLVREAMNNTQEIVEKCKDFKIKKSLVVLPLIKECKENNIDESEFFDKLIFKGFQEKIKLGLISKDKIKVYRERIKEEFDLLKAKNFIRYFLIVWEIINWCKENDIMTGPGRGSCAGCLIAWLIGITGVDPLKYDLLFARFISPDRNDLPDIDIDFEDTKRYLVKEHLQKIYGVNNVTGVSTFLRMQAKGALQDVSRVFEVPYLYINSITKLLENDTTLDDEVFTNSENSELQKFYQKNTEIIHYAQRLNGTIRGCGQHAAGICISDEDLRLGTKCNLVKRGNEIVCNWEKDNAEFMGLIKLDILGLKTLSELKECVNLIRENTQKIIKFEDINLEDKNVLEMLDSGDTAGVFQLGSYGITKYCTELGVQSFKDVYNVTALYRPGPLRSGMSKEFIKRKKGEKWKSISPVLDEITYDTYGIIVYQEQVMHILNRIALLPWGTCDKVRKVIGKSKGEEALNEFKNLFIKGCIKNKTLSRENANKIWQDIVTFGGYGFNKCILGNTKVIRSSGNQYQPKEATIDYFYKIQNAKTPAGKKFRKQGVQILQMDDDERIRPGKMKKVHYNGEKLTFKLKTKSGKEITGTFNHKLLSPTGYKELIKFKPGDKILIIGIEEGYIKKGYQTNRAKEKKYKGRGFNEGNENPSYIDGRFVYFKKAKKDVLKRANGFCEHCGIPQDELNRFEFAHIKMLEQLNGNFEKYNNKNNIKYLCNSCHKKYDYSIEVRKKRWSKGLPVFEDEIIKIESCGLAPTYDVEMETPGHNFIANGIVSHNSHSVGYSYLSMWGAWLKYYYPLEFYASCCTFARDDKKKEIVKTVLENGYEIKLPKFGISSATRWKTENDSLIMPFTEIKGVAENTAIKIEEVSKQKRVGFFGNPEISITGKLRQILNDIDAFDKNSKLDYNKAKKLNEYFIYNITQFLKEDE